MDSSTAVPTRPLPSLDVTEALQRPARSARQICRAGVWGRWTTLFAASCYALVALALATLVAGAGASGQTSVAPFLPWALGAALFGWLSGRAPWARDLAPAFYIAAVLLTPAPALALAVLLAAVAHGLARRGSGPAASLASAAHTVVSTLLLAVAAHAALGDRRLTHAILTLTAHPGAPLRSLQGASLDLVPPAVLTPWNVTAPWSVAALRAPATLALLLLLCAGYYLLETIPPALACALVRRRHPLRAWSDLHEHALPLQVVALPLGPAALALYAVAPWLTLLALPPALVAPWLAIRLRRARTTGEEARALRDDTAALYARAADADEQASRRGAQLEALLAALQGLGGNDDPAEVAATLATAATRLTPFRVCAVYLYESREGVFAPYAERLEGTRRGEVVSRARAEALMSPRNRRGFSYYIPRAPHDALSDASEQEGPAVAPGPWRDGDAMLVPLLLKNGDVLGYLRLDRPSDGRVPAAGALAPLETLASLAASVIARLRQTDTMLRLAASDGLTGLLNRRAFEEHLQRELAAATRRDRSLALMMIDIDDFGAVNNTHGHQVGDAALRLVAGVIRAHLRESDAGARYGGDEFAVVLPELDTPGAAETAERLRAALAEAARRAAADGTLPQIYTSIGVAAFPRHAADAAGLVKAADDALYVSKRLGKNRVSVR